MKYFDNDNPLDDELDYQFQKHYIESESSSYNKTGVTLSKIFSLSKYDIYYLLFFSRKYYNLKY
jgi:hypothetical protein